MKRFTLVKIPKEATDIFINDIGCIRYSHNNGRESSVIEPYEIGIYLEKEKHKIVGETSLNENRYIVIEIYEW